MKLSTGLCFYTTVSILSEYINDKMFESIRPDIKEILKLLVSSIKTLKNTG